MNGEFDPNLPLENPESAEIPYLLRFGGDGGEMDGDRFSPPSESVASQPPSVSSLEGKIPGVRVIRYVACGGMGFVYEAEQEKLGPRRVALKLLRSGFGPRGREQFQIEANVAASMLHPALVACFQAGVVNGWPYLLIQWIPGRSLAELLDEREALKQGGISLHEALDYTEQAAEAIGAAHGAGYLHLDLKPANLMLTPEGNIRVLDFGLALSRPQKDASAASSAGLTPGYAAPEQKQPGDPLGPQADIFSLMATFYHLLTGVRPDVGCEPPSALTGVDGAVDDLVSRALHRDPQHRPPTMAALALELRELRTGERAGIRAEAIVTLGPSSGASSQMVERLLRASSGASRLDVAGGDGPVRIRCLTPGSGAALGLRWLHLGRNHTAGLALSLDGPQSLAAAAQTADCLAALAFPGQFLVTRLALDRVRSQSLRDPSDAQGRPPRFHLHGRYRWPANGPGQPEVIEVVGQICPVGEWGSDPFQPPPDPGGGQPWLEDDDDCHAGGQLAAGQPAPHCPGWRLIEKLGQGGYGEVWLATHVDGGYPRAFKFCHDAARLESFRREARILRYLAAALPEESGFSRLLGEQLADAPFSLQMQYFPLGNLAQWVERQGGFEKVPLRQRLELLARAANKVAAGHQVGVIHRDLKPSNILIDRGPDPGSVIPKLADYGLSTLEEGEVQFLRPAAPRITHPSSRLWLTATRLYTAQDSILTARSDVYALGIMLLQLYAGRWDVWPGEGWRDLVQDPLVAEDIAAATQLDPNLRPEASVFADRVSRLEERRAERQREEREKANRLALRRRLRQAAFILWGLVTLAAVLGIILILQRSSLERARESARQDRETALHARETALRARETAQHEQELRKAAEEREAQARVIAAATSAIEDMWKKAQPGKAEAIFQGARKLILDFAVAELHDPESLDSGYLRQLALRFNYYAAFMAAITGKEQKNLAAQVQETAVRVNALGFKVSNGDPDFAREAVNHAAIASLLLPADTPEQVVRRRVALESGLSPGREMLKLAGATQEDYANQITILRRLGGMLKKAGDLKAAREYWEECHQVALAGEKINPSSDWGKQLHDDAAQSAGEIGKLGPGGELH